MTPRLIAGGVLAPLWLLGLPTWAVEYRVPVVNLDALTLLAHLDNSGPAPHGEARQSHLEARLDRGGFAAAVALPRRQVPRRHDPGYGGQPPAWLQVWPSARDAAWTTRQWKGHRGDRVAFVVSRGRRAWQDVAAVAASPEGLLRRMDRPASFAATMAQIRSRSGSASRVVARRSQTISCCSRRTRGRHASGVSIHPNIHVCPQAVQSPERLIPVFCAVATHTPSQGDFCVTASHRFCGTVVAETRR